MSRVAHVIKNAIVALGSLMTGNIYAGESECEQLAGDLNAVTEELNFREIEISILDQVVDNDHRSSRRR